ncbi:MAG: carboxypeptidase regulatory-like domain-containing protein [Acidobacteriaceae bacterium]|nr:carboxypeptidase regulatory-like domain-containing protein [Acidobacteriaceae bacterium]
MNQALTRRSKMTVLWILFLGIASVILPRTLFAQVDTATVSGLVVDADKALVPGATVVIQNKNNKFTRKGLTNGSGNFTFPSIAWGDYDLTITANGFQTTTVHGVHLNPGDSRTLSEITLRVGSQSEVITVSGQSLTQIDDTGERSSLITSDEISKLTLQGRDVTELLKTLPGAAINTGNASFNQAVSNTTYDNSNTQIGGASGGYSMSGSPVNGVSIRTDGANITDPGTYSGGLQNVNTEAVAEVKVSQQNFGADTANGPIVINAVTKSGGTSFHGSLYVNGRSSQFNSTDAFAKVLGYQKPPDRYIYTGATFGGPVMIPGTDINHNKRLTFFIQGENLAQRNTYAYGSASSAIQTALVPTAAMRLGDFSATQIAKYLPPGETVCTGTNTCPTAYDLFSGVRSVPVSNAYGAPITCNGNTGNDCLSGTNGIDPGAKAIVNSMPLPNTPNGQTTAGYFNYQHQNLVPNNLWTTHGKLDYKPNERHSFSLSYTQEFGNTIVPQATDYFAAGNSGGLLAPGYGASRNAHTHSGSFNWTSTWSATLTNEFFINAAYNDHYDSPLHPSQLFSSAIGYPYQGAYANKTNEPPNFVDYGYDGLPLSIVPDYSHGPMFSKTFVPGIGDNLTKVIGRHTLKAGFDFERPTVNNIQVNGSVFAPQGSITNYYLPSTFALPTVATNPAGAQTKWYSTCYASFDQQCTRFNGNSNSLANFMTGSFSGYYQANTNPQLDLYNWSNSFYVTDDFKLTKRLTVTAGLRFEHLGRWIDKHGYGVPVWRPDLYRNDPIGSSQVPLPGFRWHSIDQNTPLSGFPTRALFYSPRFGMKWDVYGNGTTIVSGGWGMFRFHEGQLDFENMLAVTNGQRTLTVSNPYQTGGLRFNYINGLGVSPDPSNVSSTFDASATGFATTTTTVYGVAANDNQSPLTQSYSFTVTQAMPKDVIFSLGYAGNLSSNLLNDGSNQQIVADNVNAIPVGGLFKANPNPQSNYYGITYTPANTNSISAAELNDYRPYPRYSQLQVVQHTLYSNYNSLQLVVSRYKPHFSFNANYTFSKTMGVRGSFNTGIPGDSFNMRNNYGPLSYDRSQILNSWYDFNIGDPYKGARILRALLNGWEVSGNTQLQSGQNLQSTGFTSNFSAQGQVNATTSQQAYQVNNLSFLGTPDVSLQPTLICNPGSNLAKNQYINGACFALPTQGGANGPFIYPYVHGPANFDTDLSAIKNFKMANERNLQVRLAGFNFINHPLPTYTNKSPNQTNLVFPTANNTDFGKITYRSGRRIVEIAIKYSF